MQASMHGLVESFRPDLRPVSPSRARRLGQTFTNASLLQRSRFSPPGDSEVDYLAVRMTESPRRLSQQNCARLPSPPASRPSPRVKRAGVGCGRCPKPLGWPPTMMPSLACMVSRPDRKGSQTACLKKKTTPPRHPDITCTWSLQKPRKRCSTFERTCPVTISHLKPLEHGPTRMHFICRGRRGGGQPVSTGSQRRPPTLMPFGHAGSAVWGTLTTYRLTKTHQPNNPKSMANHVQGQSSLIQSLRPPTLPCTRTADGQRGAKNTTQLPQAAKWTLAVPPKLWPRLRLTQRPWKEGV